VERILSAQARPRTILEALAEEERQLPPWLGEDLVTPRLTSSYQYLCEPEPDYEEKPHTTSGDAGSDGAAPADH
jgi:hypothetical protein